ncbi:hypothetical protein Tco_1531197 [Tanacetum coccineum]
MRFMGIANMARGGEGWKVMVLEGREQGEALQAKKAEALKSTTTKSSNADRSKTPTKRETEGTPGYLLEKENQAHETIMSSFKRVGKSKCHSKSNNLEQTYGTEFRLAFLSTSVMEKRHQPIRHSPTGDPPARSDHAYKATPTRAKPKLPSASSKRQWQRTPRKGRKTKAKVPPPAKPAEMHPLAIYIHNHKDHLGKLDEKADDGYLLGY